MSSISRRDLLTWFALTPTVPFFVRRSAEATTPGSESSHDGRVVVVLRLRGGNDGLNTVVPVRDDRYYRARPTIALPGRQTLRIDGSDLGLNPWLADVRRLMDDGHAGIVQGVGYPRSSRSHARATEIWETASVAGRAPEHGWLGRYLDHACECGDEPLAGVQFAESLGRTLASASGRSASIGHPELLLGMNTAATVDDTARGPRASRLDYLRQVDNRLAHAARQLHRARAGTGGDFGYPDTAFGQSLRWTGDMIETGCPTRVYYVSLGSFGTPSSASFDTHVDQLAKHRILFTELGRGLRAFARHLRRSGQLDRVLLLTFSDFGRLVAENRSGGTEHGDAGVLFVMGGRVRAGLLGEPADLGRVTRGGLDATVDFRDIYADVLQHWLGIDPAAILGNEVGSFPIVNA
jgi:uncharacterized protein (DUF1501 family)